MVRGDRGVRQSLYLTGMVFSASDSMSKSLAKSERERLCEMTRLGLRGAAEVGLDCVWTWT